MLKLSISARFSTGIKLSWNADTEEGERRKQGKAGGGKSPYERE